jgi:hypothetical protein
MAIPVRAGVVGADSFGRRNQPVVWLLRHGAAADVARLFFLVPAVTMVMALTASFGEPDYVSGVVAGMLLIASRSGAAGAGSSPPAARKA